MERVLRRHPKLKVVVPHLGADEFDRYLAMLDVHENLFLDTTMTVADYFTARPPAELYPARASRMLYGTDFPLIPYAWDHELQRIAATNLSDDTRRKLLSENALRLFDAG
jgi:predicted TIM-barrel fold metal-dependent hydrolase